MSFILTYVVESSTTIVIIFSIYPPQVMVVEGTKMKSRRSLDETVRMIEGKMPGIKKLMERYSGATWGMHWNGAIENAAYLETDKYKVAAAKWEEHDWCEDGGEIQWTECVTVYYMPKNGTEIKKITPEQIITRDRNNFYQDKRNLWKYNYVSLEAITSNEVEVAWADEKGKKGPTYRVKLE